jgi:hypothetical protein
MPLPAIDPGNSSSFEQLVTQALAIELGVHVESQTPAQCERDQTEAWGGRGSRRRAGFQPRYALYAPCSYMPPVWTEQGTLVHGWPTTGTSASRRPGAEAGISFISPEQQRDRIKAWAQFRGVDDSRVA